MNNLDAMLARISAAAPAAGVVVGARFTKTDAAPYTNADGTKGVHGFTRLCEVVSTDATGFRYAVTEVVEETGRPSFATTPAGGTMAWFGWDAALAAGRVQIVA